MAPHERVFVDRAFLEEDAVHGSLGCSSCHGGNPRDPDWRTAHQGLKRDPSYPAEGSPCAACHAEQAAGYATSLHYTLAPYRRAIRARATPDAGKLAKLDAARELHCATCHSSCGQCHLSRPDPVEGGLLAGHRFLKRPPMELTCNACHGSRIDREYLGKNAGQPPDAHRLKGFDCARCHGGAELHGDGEAYDSRYEVAGAPRCLSCHEGIYLEAAANAGQHRQHRGRVSCQVCHSVPYKNCTQCHVGRDSAGLLYVKNQPSSIGFKIGLNPRPTGRHPERFVTVRHVPVDQDTYGYYAPDALASFDSEPTWRMATPHTIRRSTPQNSSCNSCHGNRKLFLQPADVQPRYLRANQGVLVPQEAIPKRTKR